MRTADYAAVSFLDAQVGRMVDAVDDLGVTDNTIVVFTADQCVPYTVMRLFCGCR